MQAVPRGGRVQPCVREREVRRANAERAAAQTLSTALGGEETVREETKLDLATATPPRHPDCFFREETQPVQP